MKRNHDRIRHAHYESEKRVTLEDKPRGDESNEDEQDEDAEQSVENKSDRLANPVGSIPRFCDAADTSFDLQLRRS